MASRTKRTPTKIIGKAVTVDRPVDVAFKLFTDGIDEWWPDGYSVAGYGSTTVLEASVGGRLIQRSKAGQEYEIGRVIECEPPERIVVTWRMPTWDGDTEIEIRFSPEGSSTRVELEHRGWENIGKFGEDFRNDFSVGWDDILPRFVSAAHGLSSKPAKTTRRAPEVERRPKVLPRAVKKALASPTATGLLVHNIRDVKDAAGLKEGDIIISFNTMPVGEWADYYKVHCSVRNDEIVPFEVDRAGSRITIKAPRTWIATAVAPLWPIHEGEPVELRPRSTGAKFDLSTITSSPIEQWFRVNDRNGKRIGFEHHLWTRRGKDIEFLYETAYENMGRHAAKITTRFKSAHSPIESRMEDPVTGQVVTGKKTTIGGKPYWRTVSEQNGRAERSRTPLTEETFFAIAGQTLARFMTKELGAVASWTPLDEYSGETGLGVSTVCRGLEQVSIGRRNAEAWKFEVISVGRTLSTIWVDGQDILKVDSTSGSVVATTEADATKDFG